MKQEPGDPALVLYEDVHCLVVSKPVGLLTQGWVGGEDTLESTVRRHLGIPPGESRFLGTVHRLDRPVSGVVLWAKTPKAAHRLSSQFASRTIEKIYVGLVTADASIPADEWSDNLVERTTSGRVEIAVDALVKTRRAVTIASPLSLSSEITKIRAIQLRPVTGRRHQLRVQAASRGYPILGDTLYGSYEPFPEGIALHARRLTFHHPITHLPIRVDAPYPAIWEKLGLIPGEI